jgi:protein disulfide-isomerase A1
LNLAVIDTNEFGAYASLLGLESNIWPAFAIEDFIHQRKFPYDQEKEISANAISDFLESWGDGVLQPYIKSEPIPATGKAEENGVKVIVAKTWNDIVMDTQRDVLVMFYGADSELTTR